MTLIVNLEQAAAWDGDEGEHWSTHADRYDNACRGYDRHLLAAAGLTRDSVVLDVGCGTGISTRDAARVAIAGRVDGIDLSTRQLDEASRRSAVAGLANTRFLHGDAQVYPFTEGGYDVAISRFGAMFFAEPAAAFRNIAVALRPGGRLALLAWQALDRNPWVGELRAALDNGRHLPDPPVGAPGPFGLADPDQTHDWMTAAGLIDIEIQSVAEPMFLGRDPDDALTFVSEFGLTRGLLSDLTRAEQSAALVDLRHRFVEHATPSGVHLGATGWLITATRN
jgi:SAM-dependent methyltransferase